MAIPTTTEIRLPLLQYLNDEKEHTYRECLELTAEKFNVTKEERNQLIPSGLKKTFETRVLWAISELRNAILLQNIEEKRGVFKITKRGTELLRTRPTAIDNKILKKYEEFRKFIGVVSEKSEIKYDLEPIPDGAPELFAYNYNIMRQDLVNRILNKIKNEHFTFSEELVTELLEKMGYGVGGVTGKSGDGGIDAIIRKDPLGLDEIYLQAKRYQDRVPISAVRDFVGSIHIKKSQNAIFITTSDFSESTKQYAEQAGIILMDGEQLANLMVEHNVGVKTVKTYMIKDIDGDYFDTKG
jgi:restriction system protein